MVTKAQSKYIRSLAEGRARREHGAFLVEGDKICLEWLRAETEVKMVVCTGDWAAENRTLLDRQLLTEVFVEPAHMLAQLSNLVTAPDVLLIAQMPDAPGVLPTAGWVLALDTIQDPGNLGTILRIADWFGIGDVVCSPGCADAFSPKVVQAAMGAQLRVRVHTAELLDFISETELPVVAAALNGENVRTMKPMRQAVLLIGNESRGLSESLLDAASQRVKIPGKGGAESLNAAVSAGILCALLVEH